MFNRIETGDCIEGMKALPDGIVNLGFCDPPFNIGYDYDVYRDKSTPADYLDWCRSWLEQVYRVLADDGTFWLAIGPKFVSELDVLAKRIGFKQRKHVIWHFTFGVNETANFSTSHTHLLYFTKDTKRFTFNDSAIRIPSSRQLVYNDKRANPAGRIPDDTWILRPSDVPDGFAPDQDTWNVSRVCGTFKERAGWHGCQMPERVLGRIIRVCSNEGDLVLDPFSGSGTTPVVAKKLGRQYLGFELSPNYVERINARLDACNVGDELAGDDPWWSNKPVAKKGA